MNTSHLQNPSFGDYKVLCHAVWVLFISILRKEKLKKREIRANMEHPRVINRHSCTMIYMVARYLCRTAEDMAFHTGQ